ncbi:MAG: hybrid sensor histidine kinase/response regulator [Chloroflexi bacterium]|nr:hybrid sensor histidine kinase/response regulator [Chloroflexota bacterium]
MDNSLSISHHYCIISNHSLDANPTKNLIFHTERCPISDKVRILYIEDDNDSQRLIERILENQGYEVFVASDGLEGVNLAQSTDPNLILMDINLPMIDGRAVTTRLRSFPHLVDTPVVALTADISDGGRELALAAGCAGFLNKPVDVDKFPEQIEGFLHGRIHKLDDAVHSHHLKRHAENVVEQLEKKIRELESVNKLLFHLDRMKSDFIVLASHELYTPLTLVSGYASLLGEQLDQDEEQISLPASRQVAGLLNTSISRMQQVVQEIMNVARIAAGRLELAIGPIQFHILVDEVLANFQSVLAERDLDIHVDDLTNLPLIYGDGPHLKTAVSNIIENAIKYTPNGGKITVSGQGSKVEVEITIQDSGIGIPSNELEQIFEQFYSLGNVDHHSTSKSAFDGGGMGLGLTIANGIVKAHNGRLWAESSGEDREKLPGSTFIVQLPIMPPDDATD